MSAQIFPAAAEGRIKQEGIKCIRIFSNIPKGSILLGVQDQPKESESAEKICPGRTRCLLLRHPFVIQFKQIIEAPR
ncbi:hypothetical protein GQ457_10G012690 [Hibiscus cannabinus]